MQNNYDALLQKRMDAKDYSRDELVSVKTTLNLPYYNSSPEYETACGSINIDGKDYEYVMRRVYQDTLELLCLPNHAKTILHAACNELVKSTADGQATAPNKKSNTLLKISLPDFFHQEKKNSTALLELSERKYFSPYTCLLHAGYSSREEKPPQSMHSLS